MIPLIIHQIWIGPLKPPTHWMDTWREKNPDMRYWLWREAELERFGLRFKDKCDYLISKGEYRGATDIMRLEILERIGGVYVDCDSICLEPIQDAPFMDTTFFVGRDYDHKRGKYINRVANGTIGSIARHPILRKYLNQIEQTGIYRWEKLGGAMLTDCIEHSNATVLPICTFYPENYDGRKADVEGKIYATHTWGSTLGTYENSRP